MQEGVEKRFPADDSVMGAESEAEEQRQAGSEQEEAPGQQEIIPPVEAVSEEEQPESSAEPVMAGEPEDEALAHEDASLEEEEEEEEQIEKPAAGEASQDKETIPPASRPGSGPREEEKVSMEDLLEEGYDFHQPRRGDIVSGMVISKGPEGLLVDIGVKQEGIVPPSDIDRLEEGVLDDIQVGDEIPVYILRPRDRDGNLLLSIHRAQAETDWTEAQKLLESGDLWEGEVAAYNKGGLVVPFGKIRGFLPASQLVGMPRRLSEENKMKRLQEFVHQTLPLKVIEVDRRRRRLIFSHRAAWWEWKDVRREELLSELKEGETRKGVVSSLRDFGAFVDLGGADGLIHVSELAWHRVKHPNEVLRVGDEIDVYVLNIDHQRKRIGLSLKRLQPEPWSTVEDKYRVDQLVEGLVTRVVDFGAFVKLEEGIEGLVHRSELADIEPQRPGDLVKEGDLLLLRVLRIEPDRRRIGLSLRRVTEEEWSEWAAQFRQESARQEQSAEAEAGAVEAVEVETPPEMAEEAAGPEAVAAEAGETQPAGAETEEEAGEVQELEAQASAAASESEAADEEAGQGAPAASEETEATAEEAETDESNVGEPEVVESLKEG